MNQLLKNDRLHRALDALVNKIARYNALPPARPEQMAMLPWGGAGVLIKPAQPKPVQIQSEEEPLCPRGEIVETIHWKALSWLFCEFKEVFGEAINFSNKHEFYGRLAEAAGRHLRFNSPEVPDPRSLLFAVYAQGLYLAGLLDLDASAAGPKVAWQPQRSERQQRLFDAISEDEARGFGGN